MNSPGATLSIYIPICLARIKNRTSPFSRTIKFISAPTVTRFCDAISRNSCGMSFPSVLPLNRVGRSQFAVRRSQLANGRSVRQSERRYRPRVYRSTMWDYNAVIPRNANSQPRTANRERRTVLL